jgi:hypothetical protein
MKILYKQQTLFFNSTTIFAYQLYCSRRAALRFTPVSFPLRGWQQAANCNALLDQKCFRNAERG